MEFVDSSFFYANKSIQVSFQFAFNIQMFNLIKFIVLSATVASPFVICLWVRDVLYFQQK